MGAVNFILGAVAWIVLWIILILPVVFLLIYKYAVILCAKIFRPNYSTLSPNDRMVAPDSSANKPLINFGFLIKCKGSIKVEAMRDRFSTCFLEPRSELNGNLPKYPNLYSYLVNYGGYVFRNSVQEIDIVAHISERQLGQGERIEDLAAKWMLSNYMESAPNWEIIVVPFASTEETVVCFKIHHAFADGYSMLYIIDKITGVKSPYLVKPFQDSILSDIRQTIEYPSHLGEIAGDPLGNPLKITSTDKQLWMYSFTTLDLNLVKRIRRKYDAHFASVILTLLTGALRRYLLETKTKDELPPHICAGTTLPWPNHPVRSPSVTICNHWLASIVKLPLDIEDPVERLRKIEENFTNFYKYGLHKFVKRFMLPIMGLLPSRALQALGSRDPGFPVGLTSTVGGDDYKMIARPVSIIQPLIAIPDCNPFIAFSCFTFSHSGQLDVTIAGHPDQFPTHEVLSRVTKVYINQELEELRSLADHEN